MGLRLCFVLAAICLLVFSRAETLTRPIVPGDRLQLVSSDPDLCVAGRVGDDGTLAVDGVDPVPVATLDFQGAAAKMRAALEAAGILVPDLRLEIVSDRSGSISISGAVTHPLNLRLTNGADLSWLLSQASLLQDADLENITIQSQDGLERSVSASDPVRVRDGDRVFVSVGSGASDVVVAGGVVSPVSIPFRRGITVSEALAKAGGVAPIGDASKVLLMRHHEPVPLVLPDDGSLLLRPGEMLQVALRPDRRYVVVLGDVAHPGLVDFIPGMTATQAIKEAGGATNGGMGEYVWVRTIVAQAKRPAGLSLSFLQAVRIPDPVLAPDEIVEVSKH